MLALNQQVPEFVAESTAGKEFRLSDFAGKKIVLYFYPKDATPGCTIEGHEFTKLVPEFAKLNTVIFGISRDSLASHIKFKEKQCYQLDLLSDEDESLCQLFDVIKEKNMYGKMVMGIERSTFVIDENGKLIIEMRKVKAEGHAAEIFAKIKALT